MSLAPVAIVDYGMGNLRSVQNAIEHLGGLAVFVSDPMQLRQHQKIILPGVGAFSQAIACLRETGLDAALDERRDAGAHILGICLGMQLMCTVSEEDGIHQGLDWFSAKVSRFPVDSGLPVPHMGWNGVDFSHDDPMFAKLESGSDAYFVHSYRVECSERADVMATTDYGHRFDSIIRRGNVRGIQFHPEKSQGFGLGMIRNYVEMPC
jgi:glutamine amidotransferase